MVLTGAMAPKQLIEKTVVVGSEGVLACLGPCTLHGVLQVAVKPKMTPAERRKTTLCLYDGADLATGLLKLTPAFDPSVRGLLAEYDPDPDRIVLGIGEPQMFQEGIVAKLIGPSPDSAPTVEALTIQLILKRA